MKERINLSKRTRILIGVLGAVALLITCALCAEVWLKHKIRTVIETEVASLTNSRVDVGIGNISVNIPSRSISVSNIRLKSRDDNSGGADSGLVSVEASIDKITVHGVGYKKRNGKPAITAADLIVYSPHAISETKGAGVAEKKEHKTFRQAVAEKIHSISIGNISVREADLDYTVRKTDDDNTRFGLTNGNLTVHGFSIDSLPVAAGKVFFSDNMKFDASRVSYGFDAEEQTMQADTVNVDTAAGILSAKRAALIPRFSKDEFATRSKNHTDWTEIMMNGIDCTGVDFAGFFADNVVGVDSVSLAEVQIASYKNRNVRQKPNVKPMLWQTIQKLPMALDIKHLSFADLDVEYDELAENGESPGSFVLADGRGTAKNITNIAEGHEHFLTIELSSARLMNDGAVQATFLLPVDPSDDCWEVIGKVGTADMVSFNRILEPLMNVKITSGMIRSLDFHLTGTLERSHMSLTMAYNDLDVEFLKKDDHSLKRGFMTFMVDEILIRHDNPGRNGRLRKAEGYHTHDPQRSMWNYIWRSFVPAITKTVI